MDWNDYFTKRNERQAAHRAAMESRLPGCDRPEVLSEKGKAWAGIVFWVGFVALLAYLAHLG